MAQLAIKGHATRGKEVIELLKMLGGNNPHEYVADNECFGFFIDEEIRNIYYDWVSSCYENEGVIVFTLEEFLEKFPYKVGDKVQHKGATSCGSVYEVEKMRWKDNCVEYMVCILGNGSRLVFTTEDLQPYEEETIEGKITMNEDKGTLVEIDLTREFKKANEIEVILGDYEFILKDGKTYFVKKNKYPKTYEECCEVLSLGEDCRLHTKGYKASLMQEFQKLLICRDAYWKIAGEEMGLGKPWKPDWLNTEQDKFVLYTQDNVIYSNCFVLGHNVLAFPTKEMRDTFFENFKDLIETCKELL